MKQFVILPEHGRVWRQVGYRLKVLVGVPGDTISMAEAEELGLIKVKKADEPEPAPKVEEPAPKVPEPKPAPKVITRSSPKKKD